eukprot:Clim_evm14s235 gene=Clim_evmTU14s235
MTSTGRILLTISLVGVSLAAIYYARELQRGRSDFFRKELRKQSIREKQSRSRSASPTGRVFRSVNPTKLDTGGLRSSLNRSPWSMCSEFEHSMTPESNSAPDVSIDSIKGELTPMQVRQVSPAVEELSETEMLGKSGTPVHGRQDAKTAFGSEEDDEFLRLVRSSMAAIGVKTDAFRGIGEEKCTRRSNLSAYSSSTSPNSPQLTSILKQGPSINQSRVHFDFEESTSEDTISMERRSAGVLQHSADAVEETKTGLDSSFADLSGSLEAVQSLESLHSTVGDTVVEGSDLVPTIPSYQANPMCQSPLVAINLEEGHSHEKLDVIVHQINCFSSGVVETQPCDPANGAHIQPGFKSSKEEAVSSISRWSVLTEGGIQKSAGSINRKSCLVVSQGDGRDPREFPVQEGRAEMCRGETNEEDAVANKYTTVEQLLINGKPVGPEICEDPVVIDVERLQSQHFQIHQNKLADSPESRSESPTAWDKRSVLSGTDQFHTPASSIFASPMVLTPRDDAIFSGQHVMPANGRSVQSSAAGLSAEQQADGVAGVTKDKSNFPKSLAAESVRTMATSVHSITSLAVRDAELSIREQLEQSQYSPGGDSDWETVTTPGSHRALATESPEKPPDRGIILHESPIPLAQQPSLAKLRKRTRTNVGGLASGMNLRDNATNTEEPHEGAHEDEVTQTATDLGLPMVTSEVDKSAGQDAVTDTKSPEKKVLADDGRGVEHGRSSVSAHLTSSRVQTAMRAAFLTQDLLRKADEADQILARSHSLQDLNKETLMSIPKLTLTYGASIRALTTAWNFVHSFKGNGGQRPLSQERVLRILGFKPPYGDIPFQRFIGNSTILQWCTQLSKHPTHRNHALSLVASYAWKPAQYTGIQPEFGQEFETLRHHIEDPEAVVIYRAYKTYLVAVGTSRNAKGEGLIVFADCSRRRLRPLLEVSVMDLRLDLETKLPMVRDIRNMARGVFKDDSNTDNDSPHCLFLLRKGLPDELVGTDEDEDIMLVDQHSAPLTSPHTSPGDSPSRRSDNHTLTPPRSSPTSPAMWAQAQDLSLQRAHHSPHHKPNTMK